MNEATDGVIEGTVEERPDTPWTRLDAAINEYLRDFEIPDCEDDQGRTGTYYPDEDDRALIDCAIQGLLADNDLVDLIVEAREFTRATYRAEGRCEFCGCSPPAHWGNCRAARSPSP